MAARRYEISLRALKNISRVSAADEWSIFSIWEQSILLNSFFSVKGAIYYAVLATVIFSHVKISGFRAKAHLVLYISVYIINNYILDVMVIIKREQREKDQNKRKHTTSKNCLTLFLIVACEQALRGALAAGREKEGGLATRSLEF